MLRKAFFLVIALVACSSKHVDLPATNPAGWDADVSLRDAVDLNPDPKILEVRLEAKIAPVEIKPGVTTQAWTYGDVTSGAFGIPGPALRAHVGDRLVVHFKNSLPEATTIHWHGVRVPNDMDGNGASLKIAPGATFDYSFTLPDAGTFWYHPHVDSAAQLGYGLYGPIIVTDPAEPTLADETTLVLSDISLDDSGQLVDAKVGGSLGDLFGREGEILLVNGKVAPTLRTRSGAPQRWRIINAAKSRYYALALEGHTFYRVGGDGGLRESVLPTASLLVVPGERADVIVVPHGDVGSTLPLKWIPYERGFGTAFARDPEVVLNLRFDDAATATAPALPTHLRTIAPLSTDGATMQDVALTQQMTGDKTTFGINGQPLTTMLMAKVGETDLWNVHNETDIDHPFHLHGFFFQVLGDDGKPTGEWKDTINIPRRDRRKLVVKYDDRPGMWMFHCHILDHAELGMMAMLDLEEP